MNYPLPLPCGLIHVELALIKGVRLVLFRFCWTRRRETWSYSNASKSSRSQTGFICYQKPTGLLPTPHFTCNQTEFPLWNVTKKAPNENVHCLTNFRGFWEWLVAKALRLSSHRPESSGSSCLFLSCKCSWFLPPANFLTLLTPPAFQSQPTFEGHSQPQTKMICILFLASGRIYHLHIIARISLGKHFHWVSPVDMYTSATHTALPWFISNQSIYHIIYLPCFFFFNLFNMNKFILKGIVISCLYWYSNLILHNTH